MQVDPALLRDWSTTVAAASDDLGAIDVRGLFAAAAGACNGTALVRGLAAHSHTESEKVTGYRDSLDALSLSIRATADELENADNQNARNLKTTQPL